MRGINDIQSYLFTYISPEQRVPAGHPLRAIKAVADAVLKELSPLFEQMYSKMGRPSIPPEQLLKAQILMAPYSVRSDRLLAETLDYNMLFRWFLDMNLEEPSLDATTFTKNRDRLLEHADPGNPSVNFRGERRTNETHISPTDPEALLMKKGAGKEAKVSSSAHAVMENRNGLWVDLAVTQATGTSERDAALTPIGRQRGKRVTIKTLGADKGYDTRDCVQALRGQKVVPHVAAHVARKGGSAIDGRTTRHEGYTISQRIRKRVEEIVGWFKTVGGFRRTQFKGRARTELHALCVGAAYTLMRITRLMGREAEAA